VVYVSLQVIIIVGKLNRKIEFLQMPSIMQSLQLQIQYAVKAWLIQQIVQLKYLTLLISVQAHMLLLPMVCMFAHSKEAYVVQ